MALYIGNTKYRAISQNTLMNFPIRHERCFEIYPSSFTGVIGTLNNEQNAYTPYTSTNYATITAESGNREVVFLFDTAELLNDITIISVTLKVKVRIFGAGRNVQIYSGTTYKTQQTTQTDTITLTFDLSQWTKSQLSDVRIKEHSNTGDLYFYGATLTIKYEY